MRLNHPGNSQYQSDISQHTINFKQHLQSQSRNNTMIKSKFFLRRSMDYNHNQQFEQCNQAYANEFQSLGIIPDQKRQLLPQLKQSHEHGQIQTAQLRSRSNKETNKGHKSSMSNYSVLPNSFNDSKNLMNQTMMNFQVSIFDLKPSRFSKQQIKKAQEWHDINSVVENASIQTRYKEYSRFNESQYDRNNSTIDQCARQLQMVWKKRRFMRLLRQLQRKKFNDNAIIIQQNLRSYISYKKVQAMKLERAFVHNIMYFKQIKMRLMIDSQIKIRYHYLKYKRRKQKILQVVNNAKVNAPFRKSFKKNNQVQDANINFTKIALEAKKRDQINNSNNNTKKNGNESQFRKRSNSKKAKKIKESLESNELNNVLKASNSNIQARGGTNKQSSKHLKPPLQNRSMIAQINSDSSNQLNQQNTLSASNQSDLMSRSQLMINSRNGSETRSIRRIISSKKTSSNSVQMMSLSGSSPKLETHQQKNNELQDDNSLNEDLIQDVVIELQ
ncbi:UNKNOWN [Stylonychia lemnae]|uniref:Uncharacterized protein n=1 Tax=Stylonychia lemnae TaxID=5949 RepID=A0A078AT24_STYLE|nr:UNKNOWN [Stylonychia lemnae]|eukprot:CDW85339.1 UNKNOWN [Stylonychia lemnae]